MTARPILMSAPMIRALLDGKKSQTRRIVKGNALDCLDGAAFDPAYVAHPDNGLCRYGAPGDLLWASETWGSPDADHPHCHDGRKPRPGDRLVFRANPADDYQWGAGKPSQGGFSWRPSIHMPRWASRVTLELIEVRVERLWDISEADALAEGINTQLPMFDAEQYDAAGMKGNVYREQYRKVWESINGLDSWDANPWVWALSFDVHRCNVDQLHRTRTA